MNFFIFVLLCCFAISHRVAAESDDQIKLLVRDMRDFRKNLNGLIEDCDLDDEDSDISLKADLVAHLKVIQQMAYFVKNKMTEAQETKFKISSEFAQMYRQENLVAGLIKKTRAGNDPKDYAMKFFIKKKGDVFDMVTPFSVGKKRPNLKIPPIVTISTEKKMSKSLKDEVFNALNSGFLIGASRVYNYLQRKKPIHSKKDLIAILEGLKSMHAFFYAAKKFGTDDMQFKRLRALEGGIRMKKLQGIDKLITSATGVLKPKSAKEPCKVFEGLFNKSRELVLLLFDKVRKIMSGPRQQSDVWIVELVANWNMTQSYLMAANSIIRDQFNADPSPFKPEYSKQMDALVAQVVKLEKTILQLTQPWQFTAFGGRPTPPDMLKTQRYVSFNVTPKSFKTDESNREVECMITMIMYGSYRQEIGQAVALISKLIPIPLKPLNELSDQELNAHRRVNGQSTLAAALFEKYHHRRGLKCSMVVKPVKIDKIIVALKKLELLDGEIAITCLSVVQKWSNQKNIPPVNEEDDLFDFGTIQFLHSLHSLRPQGK